MKKDKKIPKYINIVIYIMLIGIIISLLIDKSIIIGNEKQIIKEMTEGEYESKLTELNKSHEDYALQVQENKKKLATAITNQKVATSEDATIDEMVTNIGKILQAGTSDATATAEDIAEGKTAWVNGVEIIGTKQDNSLIYIGNSENSTYDLTSIDGYENFTIENFCIKNFNQTVKVIKSGPVYATTATTNPLSYNSTTGILTAKSSIGPNQHQHLEFSCTYDIYLQK